MTALLQFTRRLEQTVPREHRDPGARPNTDNPPELTPRLWVGSERAGQATERHLAPASEWAAAGCG